MPWNPNKQKTNKQIKYCYLTLTVLFLTQLNGFMYCYLTLIILFNMNYFFANKCFQVFLFNTNYSFFILIINQWKKMNSCIWPFVGTLTGLTIHWQSGPRSNGNERVFHITQSSKICSHIVRCTLISYRGQSVYKNIGIKSYTLNYTTAWKYLSLNRNN